MQYRVLGSNKYLFILVSCLSACANQTSFHNFFMVNVRLPTTCFDTSHPISMRDIATTANPPLLCLESRVPSKELYYGWGVSCELAPGAYGNSKWYS